MWCNRCKKYHMGKPLDEKELIEKHSSDIAREIDQEVLSKITGAKVAYELQKRAEKIVEKS